MVRDLLRRAAEYVIFSFLFHVLFSYLCFVEEDPLLLLKPSRVPLLEAVTGLEAMK